VFPVNCPPLRERKDDIPLLIDYCIKNFCEENNFKCKRFSPEAIERMKKYAWKGNIRELKNTVERLLILSGGEVIHERDLPENIRSDMRVMLPDFRSLQTLKEFKDSTERAFLVEKLKENNWNISLTAQKIDTPRSNLYKKLEQYKISEKTDSQ
jgi:two-component system nitrogen regulation response regulator NtrX